MLDVVSMPFQRAEINLSMIDNTPTEVERVTNQPAGPGASVEELLVAAFQN